VLACFRAFIFVTPSAETTAVIVENGVDREESRANFLRFNH